MPLTNFISLVPWLVLMELKKSQWGSKKQDHKGKYKDLIIPRITKIARGARLSEERIQTIVIGEDLTHEERCLFLVCQRRSFSVGFFGGRLCQT
jgi:hypothetical protein